MHVRCRKCENCKRMRAARWRSAAMAEIRDANRTWFATFTLSPEQHFLAAARARRREHLTEIDFEALPLEEQFRMRHRQCGRLLTLWLKKVRKASKAHLRYLIVAEEHKTGLPHYHALVHEIGDIAVTKRQLQGKWPWGFTTMKLVSDPRAAMYVTKYIAKSSLARVRASERYGQSSVRRTIGVAVNKHDPRNQNEGTAHDRDQESWPGRVPDRVSRTCDKGTGSGRLSRREPSNGVAARTNARSATDKSAERDRVAKLARKSLTSRVGRIDAYRKIAGVDPIFGKSDP